MDEDLKRLLEENLAVTKETNKLLRQMRREAIIGNLVRLALYLVILGLPIFFLSQYLGPLLNAVTAPGEGESSGIFVAPTPEQLESLKELYGM